MSRLSENILITLSLLFILAGCGLVEVTGQPVEPHFDGRRAYEDIQTQVSFGPRTPGTTGHRRAVAWMGEELEKSGWMVTQQTGTKINQPIVNLIAHRGEEGAYILIGTHYDTRIYADQDPEPDRRREPVPGANDGASGVAVLLELARTLPENLDVPVRLVFFDAEDNGNIPGWDWILGSRLYVESMNRSPAAVVIVDMVGDRELELYREKTSTLWLQDQIWATAHSLGYQETFLNSPKYAILDDHTPFLEAGIPAVDIIDFDYPFWHTTSDTIDKVSPESLQIVGDTLLTWLVAASPTDLQ